MTNDEITEFVKELRKISHQTAMVNNYNDFIYANSSYFLFYYGWNMVNKDINRENVIKAIQMTTFALILFLGANTFHTNHFFGL